MDQRSKLWQEYKTYGREEAREQLIAEYAYPDACRVTTISRGIAFGGELEYADEMTLARSLQNRLPIESYVSGR